MLGLKAEKVVVVPVGTQSRKKRARVSNCVSIFSSQFCVRGFAVEVMILASISARCVKDAREMSYYI